MVATPLANPVGLAFLSLLFPLLLGLLLLLLDSGGDAHVLRLTLCILLGFGLLTPEAVLTALEVVVLAFGALPAAIWEAELLVVSIRLGDELLLRHKGFGGEWREIGHSELFLVLSFVQSTK